MFRWVWGQPRQRQMYAARDHRVLRAAASTAGEVTAGTPALHPFAPLHPSAAVAAAVCIASGADAAVADATEASSLPTLLMRLLHALLATDAWPCCACTASCGAAAELASHFPRMRLAGARGDDDDVPAGPDRCPGGPCGETDRRARYRWLLWAAVHRSDRADRTPLYMAAQLGHADCVGALLALGADPTKPNVEGRTPLHMAAKRLQTRAGRAVLVRMMCVAATDDAVGNRVNWAALDKDGLTPLHYLVLTRDAAVVDSVVDTLLDRFCCDTTGAAADVSPPGAMQALNPGFACGVRRQLSAALAMQMVRHRFTPLEVTPHDSPGIQRLRIFAPCPHHGCGIAE